ncbi:hypothetical protein D5072_02715 [Dickeya dianthicola]|uniref:Uncharacterized protein n=1 Tax=Dickeya dianthicola TaxID=204039 RepID=A0ABX9NLT2_9GAMM|nr:hypothetical protein D5077_18885 [Dickeya dianthicola]RJL73609.1 hypothetical protein D5072_02715 [Dickeya dianthicola]
MGGARRTKALSTWRREVFFISSPIETIGGKYATQTFSFSVRMRREQDDRRCDCHRSLLG